MEIGEDREVYTNEPLSPPVPQETPTPATEPAEPVTPVEPMKEPVPA